ncbi:MAG: ferrochelatase [Alphaproteobacteria bacterium]|nr:ferrochelatase [Alphaproteobacteria bacterium]
MTDDFDTSGRRAVLIVNLGTPSAPTPKAVRRYLAEFLSDRRVVDYPRLFWLPVLYGIILNTRPARSARNYAKIWRADTNESPLRYYTRLQAAALAPRLAAPVEWAMRYGAPSVAEGLAALAGKGAARIRVVPLYPQYSTTTTGSVEDAVRAARARLPASLEIDIARPYFDHPLYIDALAAGAREAIGGLGWTPERIVISFHGVPERLVRAGDPYQAHCETTARLLRAATGWSEETAPIAYQSRFGPEKWLGPATDEMLDMLAAEGAKRVAVITPGFVADCVETLEEIAIAGRRRFLAAGGEQFAAIPCLNDSAGLTALLEDLARD